MSSQEKNDTLIEQVKKLPDKPGVYFFLGKNDEILYIGKATSLRDRVRSYFATDLLQTRGRLLVDMIVQAEKIDCTPTDSVLEALLLEANLIRTHQPRYNTKEKDNKSYNYVVFTDEDFPKVLTIRGRNLLANKKNTEMVSGHSTNSNISSYSVIPAQAGIQAPGNLDSRLRGNDNQHKNDKLKYKYIFGPFPHGSQLKEAMKIIRKIFPFSDAKCVPCEEQKQAGRMHCRPCFNRQIGLCPGVCTGEISKEEYAEQIKNLKLFFEGRKKDLLKNLDREMNQYAKQQEFEKAAHIRETVFALNHIQDIALLKQENKLEASAGGQFNEAHREEIFRIEAYDVAHSSGKNVVGVMTVVEDNEINKSQYRKFKIKINPGVNDPGALKEILRRRLGHLEWPLPNIIVVDGAQAQLNAARSVLKERGLTIDVVAVVKDERHKPREILGDETLVATHGRAMLLANNEAHRFALTYHRKKRDSIV